MAKLGVIRFAGKSGTQYRFNAYPLGTAFKKGMGAVYVVTRRRQVEPDGAFTHKQMYLGQTDDLRQPLTGQGASLADRGANCICVHGEKDEAARLGIQQDLAR
jgi:hypothetical protein